MQDQDALMNDFLALSREYADALEALGAIEAQVGTIVTLGGADELRRFVEQFIEMSRRARERSEESGEAELATWFQELIDRAGQVLAALAER